MLEHLTIKNFAIIEDLDIDFPNGFISLSGETGAGKSIIIEAIFLLMGERASYEKIRLNKSRAFIEGVFKIESETTKMILDNYIDEDDRIIISRILDKTGKTTIKINDHIITVSTLKRVSSLLLDIHSQQKDHDFLQSSRQIDLLDLYISKTCTPDEFKIYETYRCNYQNYIDLKNEYNNYLQEYSCLDDLETLKYQFDELEKIDIKEHEMEDLEEEKEKLSSFSRMSERINNFLSAYEEAKKYLYDAKKSLDNIDNADIDPLKERFITNYFELEDVNNEISYIFDNYFDMLERLEYITNRLSLLHSLRRKYGYSSEEIIAYKDNLSKKLNGFSNFQIRKNEFQEDIKNIENELLENANKLTKLRRKYSNNIEDDINNQLKDLYLENASFKVNIDFIDEFNKKGNNNVIFLLKANAGGEYLPLEKTASLGETSRLNLALKTVFNDLNPVDTIIFDEIDVGVSGRVAYSLANKMKMISAKSQVICISHLPQICAKADYHYYVKKEVVDDLTYSSIKLLNDDERIYEIAKMLSNEKVNEASLKAAKEMLNK